MPDVIVIPADLATPVTRTRLDRLEDFQQVVGGPIEPVDLPAGAATLFVNEEGLPRHLRLNLRALFLWWYWQPHAWDAALVGDAILTGPPDEDGNTTSLDAVRLAAMTEPRPWQIQTRTATDVPWVTQPVVYGSFFDALVFGLATTPGWPNPDDYAGLRRITPAPQGSTPAH